MIRKMSPYLLVNVTAFYLLPVIIRDTGTAMMVMLAGIPAICLITAMIYGVKHGWNGLYCLAVALLFIPTIFIYYNGSAWVYIIGYGLLALVGNTVGKLFHKSGK